MYFYTNKSKDCSNFNMMINVMYYDPAPNTSCRWNFFCCGNSAWQDHYNIIITM